MWKDFRAFEGEDVARIVTIILIGLFYGLGFILQKANKWLNKKRQYNPNTPKQTANRQTRQQSRQRDAGSNQPSEEQRPNLFSELEKRLREATGEPVEPNRQFGPEDKPRPKPVQSKRQFGPEDNPRPQREKWRMESSLRPDPAIKNRRMQQKGTLNIAKSMPHEIGQRSVAATVAARQKAHLAILRNPDDMRKAILAAEILAPPRSRRPLRPGGHTLP